MDSLVFFLVGLVLWLNTRSIGKLVADWIRMRTAVRFVQDACNRLGELPSEEALERHPRAPIFLHLVAAYQEPDIAGTVQALLGDKVDAITLALARFVIRGGRARDVVGTLDYLVDYVAKARD